MTLQLSRSMATHTSNPSSDSLEKTPLSGSKDISNNEADQPIKSEEEEESLKKMCDNGKEKEVDQTRTTSTVKSSSSAKAALMKEVQPPPSDITTMTAVGGGSSTAEESGRERLSRHRREMAGRVWIPDTWGQEGLLKDWIDCNAFDSSLVNNNIFSARAALMQQRSTSAVPNNPTLLRGIENRC